MSDIIELTADRARSARAMRRTAQIKANLPPADTTRWVASRKAAVVAAVKADVISEAEVARRYGVSEEELQQWKKSLEKHGVGGLRATRVQLYRHA